MTSTRRRVRSAAVLVLALVALAVGAFLLAPPQLGGRTSFVVTTGTSMLPTMQAGGVVALRAQDSYDVGDVVAYRDRFAASVVLHRVVALDGERLVLQGDNNPQVDSYRPFPQDVVGERWVYWQDGGRWLLTLRHPAVGGVALGLAAAFALRSPLPAAPSRHAHGHRRSSR